MPLSSLKLSINFYQQVKFTRPLTLQDCDSPVLLTVSPTYWSDCEWEGDRLIYFESEYHDLICHIRLTCSRLKIHFDGGSHEKRVLWSYMYKVLWRREDQLWNQNFLGKVKLIKIQFNAFDLFLTRERPYLYFSSDLQPLSFHFVGLGLHL